MYIISVENFPSVYFITFLCILLNSWFWLACARTRIFGKFWDYFCQHSTRQSYNYVFLINDTFSITFYSNAWVKIHFYKTLNIIREQVLTFYTYKHCTNGMCRRSTTANFSLSKQNKVHLPFSILTYWLYGYGILYRTIHSVCKIRSLTFMVMFQMHLVTCMFRWCFYAKVTEYQNICLL